MKHLLTLAALLVGLVNAVASSRQLDVSAGGGDRNGSSRFLHLGSQNIGEVLVHRFYVEAQDPTDVLLRFLMNNEDPLVINAPGGVYSHPLNSSWNASGVDHLVRLFGFCVNYDSFATITLDGPAPYAWCSRSVLGSRQPCCLRLFADIQNTLGEPVELNVNTLYCQLVRFDEHSNSLPDEDGRNHAVDDPDAWMVY